MLFRLLNSALARHPWQQGRQDRLASSQPHSGLKRTNKGQLVVWAILTKKVTMSRKKFIILFNLLLLLDIILYISSFYPFQASF